VNADRPVTLKGAIARHSVGENVVVACVHEMYLSRQANG
jgi:hypothetical protein